MPKIPAKLRLDDQFEGDIDKVQNMLDDAYNDMAPSINRKIDMVIQNRDPNSLGFTDDDHDLVSLWLNSASGAKFQLTASPSTWIAY